MDKSRTEFAKNLEKIIEAYGVKNAMNIIDVMLIQEIEMIEELNDCFVDELSYIAENG